MLKKFNMFGLDQGRGLHSHNVRIKNLRFFDSRFHCNDSCKDETIQLFAIQSHLIQMRYQEDQLNKNLSMGLFRQLFLHFTKSDYAIDNVYLVFKKLISSNNYTG
jgi:hypothetical protein